MFFQMQNLFPSSSFLQLSVASCRLITSILLFQSILFRYSCSYVILKISNLSVYHFSLYFQLNDIMLYYIDLFKSCCYGFRWFNQNIYDEIILIILQLKKYSIYNLFTTFNHLLIVILINNFQSNNVLQFNNFQSNTII